MAMLLKALACYALVPQCQLSCKLAELVTRAVDHTQYIYSHEKCGPGMEVKGRALQIQGANAANLQSWRHTGDSILTSVLHGIMETLCLHNP